jgi:hypothetical protein
MNRNLNLNLASLLMIALPFAAGVAAVAQEAGEEEAKVGVGEMEAKADVMIEKMRSSRKYVQNLLDAARKEKDIIKITCLNDKLTQINVSIRTFEDRSISLRTAIQTGDTEAINHEYNILSVLNQKVDGLRLKAEACIGETEGYLGKTEVTVSRPPGEAEMDPTTFDEIGGEVVERPPPASAFE